MRPNPTKVTTACLPVPRGCCENQTRFRVQNDFPNEREERECRGTDPPVLCPTGTAEGHREEGQSLSPLGSMELGSPEEQ